MRKCAETTTITIRVPVKLKEKLGREARVNGYSGISELVREAVARRHQKVHALPLADRQLIQGLSLDLQRFIGILQKAALCGVVDPKTSTENISFSIIRPIQTLVRRLEKLAR